MVHIEIVVENFSNFDGREINCSISTEKWFGKSSRPGPAFAPRLPMGSPDRSGVNGGMAG